LVKNGLIIRFFDQRRPERRLKLSAIQHAYTARRIKGVFTFGNRHPHARCPQPGDKINNALIHWPIPFRTWNSEKLRGTYRNSVRVNNILNI